MGQKGRGWDRALPEGFEEWKDMGRNRVRRCWARTKATGKQCTRPAASGQKVCQLHGGAAAQNLAKGRERVAEEKARVLVATYGLKIETTATEALLEEVQRTAGHVAWLGDRVRELDPDAMGADTDKHPLVWGVTKEKTGGEDRGITEEATPSEWLKLYQQERDHLVKVCSAAIKAGIEERRVQLAESQGALVAQVIRAILGDLQLTVEQQARVPEVVPRHLRALASG
jgi:hypothetical protein